MADKGGKDSGKDVKLIGKADKAGMAKLDKLFGGTSKGGGKGK